MKIVVVLMFTVGFGAMANGQTAFKGTVTDATGASIARAVILVHWDSAGTPGLATNVGVTSDLIATSDVKGSFRLELPPGFYDVFVSAVAFSPTCRKIRMLPTLDQDVTFRLDADPLV